MPAQSASVATVPPMRASQRSRMILPVSSAATSVHSFLWWACAWTPGPKFAAGTPAAAKRATSVQACFGSTAATPLCCERGDERVIAPRGRRRRDVDETDLGLAGDERFDARLGALDGRAGPEAVVQVELEAIGDDVARAPAAARASR